MNRVVGWVLAAAVLCFAAGFACGRAWPSLKSLVVGAPAPQDPDAELLARYVDAYGLDAKQVRYLSAILSEMRLEREKIFLSDPQKLPPELRTRYETALRATDKLILEILDERQREKYWADMKPQTR